MDRVLVVMIGGLGNKYVGKGVRAGQPASWLRIPARFLPNRFAKPEEVRTIKDIEAAVGDQLLGQLPGKEIHFLPVSFSGRFHIGVFSQRNPEDLAKEINDQIEEKYTGLMRNGDTISLVILAYSAGALLAQQAMLLGLHNQSPNICHAPWPRMVKALVIFSGITKGWQFTTATPAPLRFLGQAVRFLLPLNFLGWKLYRGSPFVVGTRLSFFDAFSCNDHKPILASNESWNPPRTIFFLGSKDEFVTPSDCLDLDPGMKPVYIEIPHTTHSEMLNATGTKGGLVPRLIAEAITSSFDGQGKGKHSKDWMSHAADVSDIDDYLDPLDLKDDHKPDSDVEHVVIVMHGIRDDGFWAKRISREIKTLYRATHPGDNTRRLRTVTPSYGFFSMWDFLFPGGRTKALYWFLDKYADIRRLYPRATKIDLIAHSNGTYLGAEALKKCENIRFRRMLFAGSVVRRDFWMQSIKELPQRLEAFHNFIGREDLIVALLPGAMETIPLLNNLLDVGGAGAFGFLQLPNLSEQLHSSYREPSWLERLGFGAAQRLASGNGPHQASQRMIHGGHGAAIQEECWKTIAKFIVEDTISMEEILNSNNLDSPSNPLRKASRGWASTMAFTLIRLSIGALIVPSLLFLLLFPLWYPSLVLHQLVPALNPPLAGHFAVISASIYIMLFALVWLLRNGLRYL